jgi:hypothetical protein
MAAANEERCLVEMSGFDVDGVIIIAELPHILELDHGSINLSTFKFTHSKQHLRSLDTRQFDDWKEVTVGYSRGMPISLITDVERDHFKAIIVGFLASCSSATIGVENAWLVNGNDTPDSILQEMENCQHHNVKISINLLKDLQSYVVREYPNNRIYGLVHWFGQKMPLSRWQHVFSGIINHDQVLVSCLHLGIGFHVLNQKGLLGISSDYKSTFSQRNSTWFFPLGIKDVCSCVLDKGNVLLNNFSAIFNMEVSKIRIYNPPLMHCRSPGNKFQRAQLVASALIGGGAYNQGPYRSLYGKGHLWLKSVSSVLKTVCQDGAPIRMEFVVSPLEAINTINATELANNLYTLISPMLEFVPVEEIDSTYYNNTVQLLQSLHLQSFKSIAAAESFLSFVVDGGTLRLYYPGLRAALGNRTLGEAMADGKPQICPLSIDYSHVTWQMLSLDKLATPLAYMLNISEDAAHKILLYLETHPWADGSVEEEALYLIKLIARVESLHFELTFPESWSPAYHATHGTLSGSLEAEDLLEVMLYERPHRGLKAIQTSILQSWLTKIPNGKTVEDLKEALVTVIKEEILVWPHSQPSTTRDRTDRWWKIGLSPSANRLKTYIEKLCDALPNTASRCSHIVSLSMHNEMVATAWEDALAYTRQAHLSRSIKRTYMWLFIIILSTHLERQRRRNPCFHPFLDWGEMRIKLTDSLNLALEKLGSQHILDKKTPGTAQIETLFNMYTVPENVNQRFVTFHDDLVANNIVINMQEHPIDIAPQIPPIFEGADSEDSQEAIGEPEIPIPRRRRRGMQLLLADNLNLQHNLGRRNPAMAPN